MARCGCGAITPSGCLCEVIDSACWAWDGLVLEPVISADSDNLLVCTAEGMNAPPPAVLLNPPACRVFRTSNQSIPNNTLTAVTFNQESYDTDTMHSTAALTNRVTFTTAGVYTINFTATWNKTPLVGNRIALIRKNGSDILAYETREIGGSDLFVSHDLTITEEFSATDYVEGMVQHTAGAALLLLSGEGAPILSAALVAA